MSADDCGGALRALRNAHNVSLRALARRSSVSFGLLSNIERGERRLTAEVAQACDRALGTTVLTTLVRLERNDVRRRELLEQIGALGVATATGAWLADEALRLELTSATTAADAVDWDAIVSDYRRRLVNDPSPALGRALRANLGAINATIKGGNVSRDVFRGAANLAQLYGLHLGNAGQLAGAQRWYALAVRLADASRDPVTRTWARGRSLSRGVYETYSIQRTLTGADEALAITAKATAGALEAHAAKVHAYALTGDLRAGRAAVNAMYETATQLPDDETSPALARTAFLGAFLESRVGPLESAVAASDVALGYLDPDYPLWSAETRIYRDRARVAAGDVSALRDALDVVRSLAYDVRVIAVAVADVLSVVPAGYRGDELPVLAGYASAAVPWRAS